MQMLPVMAMCGQRCGLHMTATTLMPEAERMGFAVTRGCSRFLHCSGMAAMTSTSFGLRFSP
jgi:hypothetical protein